MRATFIVNESMMGPGGVDMGNMGAWAWVMGLMGVLFMLLVVGLIVWLVVFTTRGQPGARPEAKGPLEILDERYARGELDREEYQEKRADLER